MNKGLKYVLAVLLAVVVCGTVFYFVSNRERSIVPNEGIDVYVDPQGETYLAIKDENTGETMAGVTDEDKNLYAAKIDEDGNVQKDGDLYPVEDYTGLIPTNDTTAVSIQEENSESHDFGKDAVVSDPSGTETEYIPTTEEKTTSKKSDKNDTTKKSSKETEKTEYEHLADRYKTLFASGTYYVEFTTNDDTMESPVTAAVKNGNIYMKTQLEGKNCTMIYQKKKDNVYVVLTDYHIYCQMPSSMMEDLDMSDFGNSDTNVTKINVSNVILGDKNCVCEKYTLDDGSTSSYYFYEEALVRMDQIDSSGTTTIMNITKISSDVDDSLFVLPKGFVPLNLSKLDLGLDSDESTTEKAK